LDGGIPHVLGHAAGTKGLIIRRKMHAFVAAHVVDCTQRPRWPCTVLPGMLMQLLTSAAQCVLTLPTFARAVQLVLTHVRTRVSKEEDVPQRGLSGQLFGLHSDVLCHPYKDEHAPLVLQVTRVEGADTFEQFTI
jgi:hypothetical protein